MMTKHETANRKPAGKKQGIVTPRLILGLTLIAIGVIYTLERLGYTDAEQWIRWWPAILVVAGLGKLLFPGSSAGRWTGALIAGVGLWLLGEELDLIDESFFDWWPVLLILFGIRFVAQGLLGRRRWIESDAHTVNAMAVLGGGARTNTSADFRGGDLMVFMGGYEIDLRQARIQNSPAVIDAFAFWGGIDIRVPDDWKVTVRGIPLLGAFEDSTSLHDEAIPGPEQELVVKGFAIMGGGSRSRARGADPAVLSKHASDPRRAPPARPLPPGLRPGRVGPGGAPALPGRGGEGGTVGSLPRRGPGLFPPRLLLPGQLYLCRTFPLGESRAETVLGATLVSAVMASGAVVALGLPWTGALAAAGLVGEGVAGLYASRLVLVGVYALFLYLLSVALHYLFLALERSRRAEARAYEARLTAREAELQALRAQVDPHFLFNSLNSIAALVGAEPKRARRMCGRLASFLRRTLQVGGRERIRLGEELSLADDYLAVEQIRFGERLRVEREVDGDVADVPVPPLVLQPLVENAVRHGIARLVDGGEVRIRARPRRRGGLELEVENPYDGRAPGEERHGGVGLENVRRRLRAAYGDEASLTAEGQDGVFRVRLGLPAESAEPTKRKETTT